MIEEHVDWSKKKLSDTQNLQNSDGRDSCVRAEPCARRAADSRDKQKAELRMSS
jgi:hypothetical protein